jgi:hypothetical protein
VLWNHVPPEKPPPNWPPFKEQSKMWANTALALNDSIPPEARCESCKFGWVVSKMVLATLARDEGDMAAFAKLKSEIADVERQIGSPQLDQEVERMLGDEPTADIKGSKRIGTPK